MDGVREFLADLKAHALAEGELLGLFNVLIGRRITRADGTLVSNGLTWRTLATSLKKVRWDKNAVGELGLTPAELPPRDRERFWYTAIGKSQVDSEKARQAGDHLAESLRKEGYSIGPAPPE